MISLLTGVLYFGPLLAGLIGQGWAMVPAFVAVFLISSVILHPQMWPRSTSDLSTSDLAQGEAVVALASLVATQVLLVVVLFAVGRGIGGVMGFQPGLPPYFPVALSFLTVPVSRLLWNPNVPVQTVGFDPNLHKAAGVPRDTGVSEMLGHVIALGDDVAEDVVQGHLTAIADHLDPALIRSHLAQAVASGQATRAGVKALIVHATDPALSSLMAGTGYPAQGFAAAGHDPDLLALFARRCALMLEDDPDLAPDCPNMAALDTVALAVADPARAALNRLAGLLAQGGPAEGRVSLAPDMR